MPAMAGAGSMNAYSKPHRLYMTPGKMKQRLCTVEHVFGTLKFRMCSAHFLIKRLKNVKTEMSLLVRSWNLRRVINFIGVETPMLAIRRKAVTV